MTVLLWVVLGGLAVLAMAAIGEVVSERARSRLGHVPHALLLLAARRLDPPQRVTVYSDEWLPELTYILTGGEARPVTRLVRGTCYASGLFMSAGRVCRQLRPAGAESRKFRRLLHLTFTVACVAALSLTGEIQPRNCW